MYDPLTVAHEIRYPVGHPSGFGNHRYRAPFITIWHRDPELPGRGRRRDDSCGWFHPPTTAKERQAIEKLARREYSTIFERQARTREGKNYADICFEPSAYDAVYWSWRAIKFRGAKGWKFGERRVALTASELDAIYRLSANPVDNVRNTVARIAGEDDFVDFFFTVYSSFKRHHRLWYAHPRWHVHHWRIQVHPWQRLRRWLLTRCCVCGKRFGYNESPVTGCWDTPPLKFMRGETHLYHMSCGSAVMTPPQARGTSNV